MKVRPSSLCYLDIILINYGKIHKKKPSIDHFDTVVVSGFFAD